MDLWTSNGKSAGNCKGAVFLDLPDLPVLPVLPDISVCVCVSFSDTSDTIFILHIFLFPVPAKLLRLTKSLRLRTFWKIGALDAPGLSTELTEESQPQHSLTQGIFTRAYNVYRVNHVGGWAHHPIRDFNARDGRRRLASESAILPVAVRSGHIYRLD